MAETEFSLASAAGERLGGCGSIGDEVRTDADLVTAVEAGLPPESLAVLGAGGVSGREVAALVINPARCRIGGPGASGSGWMSRTAPRACFRLGIERRIDRGGTLGLRRDTLN